jgi:hypothetical protein
MEAKKKTSEEMETELGSDKVCPISPSPGIAANMVRTGRLQATL